MILIKAFKSYNPCLFGKHHTVIRKFFSAYLFKSLQQVFYLQILLLFPCYIVDDPTFVHHNQTVADLNRIFHVMGNHKRGQILFIYDLFGEIEDFAGCFGIEGGGVFV